MDRSHRTIAGALLAILAAACMTAASAAIITVGQPDKQSGGTCDCFELQCALDMAVSNASSGGLVNEIRLTDSHILTDEGAHTDVQPNATLTITGGFPTCDDTLANGQQRGIDGHHSYSGTIAPVFSFTTGAGAIVHMRLLDIGNGQGNGGNGGAIRFTGGGSLDISQTHMAGNNAAFGGGVYFEAAGTLWIADSTIESNTGTTLGGGVRAYGTSANAKVILGPNIMIQGNIAANGGGIAISGLLLTMDALNSLIQNNQAPGGAGGGLYIRGHDGLAGHAHIGSPGNVILSNTAALGGGVAIVASDGADGDDAYLTLSSTNPANPTSIFVNGATSKGGGIYLVGADGSMYVNTAHADIGNHAKIVGNYAPIGSAAYLDNVVSGNILNENVFGSSLTMTSGAITNNTSEDSGFNPTDGAIIHVGDSNYGVDGLRLNSVEFRNNLGGPVVRSDANTVLKNVLIANNTTQSSVLDSIGSDGAVTLTDSTIANNTIGGTYVVTQKIDTTLQRLVIDQPGKAILHKGGGSTTVQQVMTTDEVATLNAGPEAVAYPSIRFVDPANGDYHLRAASPAVDRAGAVMGEPADFDGLSRDVDLPFNANVFGPRDLGAFERQAVQPLVLNADFDLSSHFWTTFAGAWDGTSNATGASGSGSWKYSAPDSNGHRVVLAQQCVFLPGPAGYVISGWGHTSGFTVDTRDYARLAWEFRNDGGEACTDGTPTASGEFTLGHSTGWTQATNPVSIDVFEWSHNSSITVYLVASAGTITTARSINAWFDGIAIAPQTLVDLIFASGFQ
jgi:hypothetical protein